MAATAAAHGPRFYLSNSAVHDSTGATLSATMAHQLLNLAPAHDLVIVETISSPISDMRFRRGWPRSTGSTA